MCRIALKVIMEVISYGITSFSIAIQGICTPSFVTPGFTLLKSHIQVTLRSGDAQWQAHIIHPDECLVAK